MDCYSCARGLHLECLTPKKRRCCCVDEYPEQAPFGRESNAPDPDRAVGISAGRKEAAKLHQLDREAPCEWRGLANCGGGLNPITGCVVGKQEARHHGPVKKTTKNNRGNIHKICTKCHNLWHGQNDPVYNEKVYATLPHNPRAVTVEEIMKRGVVSL